MELFFYRRKTNRNLYSFGDPIRDIPIMEKPLSVFQEEVISTVYGNLIDIDDHTKEINFPHIQFDDDLVFTSDLIKEVVKEAKVNNKNFRICLHPNFFNDRFVLPSDKDTDCHLRFQMYYRYNDHQEYQDIYINQKLLYEYLELPSQIVYGKRYYYCLCSIFIAQITSPFQLLQVNMALNINRMITMRRFLPEKIYQRFFSINTRWSSIGLRLKNKIGKYCKIHKTAVLEGVIIGDYVTIGANAVIKMSRIGTHSTLEDLTCVRYSVLGENTYICAQNSINFCLTYPEVFLIHGPYQFSIFGKNVAALAVINADYRLDQKNIHIPSQSGVVDSKQSLLGIAYGHYSKVGGGNVIAPGRIIPNKFLIPPPGYMIKDFDE